MRLVPEERDRAWIIRHLAELIEERGSKPFLEAKLIEPSSEFFPDTWRADEASVVRLLRRVLGYAGLGSVEFQVELFDPGFDEFGQELHTDGVQHVHETTAWFAGLDDDAKAYFGVARENLDDAEGLVGVLCHEVAHAYRARHGLTYFDAADDELLTDLTTVYLGFGVLTANLSHRYRRRQDSAETSMGGYLSPVAMCFALAAQAVARDMPRAACKKLARSLEPAQEGCFLASQAVFDKQRDELMRELGLGGRPRPRDKTSRASRANEGQLVYRIAGGWLRRARCSGLDCGGKLEKTDEVCARCGGVVSGDVRSAEEAAAAEQDAASAVGKGILEALKRNRPK